MASEKDYAKSISRLFYHVMSVHTGGEAVIFFSDCSLHTNNKIDLSASCSTSRVNIHFILFFPLRKIKARRLCESSHTSQSISLKGKKKKLWSEAACWLHKQFMNQDWYKGCIGFKKTAGKLEWICVSSGNHEICRCCCLWLSFLPQSVCLSSPVAKFKCYFCTFHEYHINI